MYSKGENLFYSRHVGRCTFYFVFNPALTLGTDSEETIDLGWPEPRPLTWSLYSLEKGLRIAAPHFFSTFGAQCHKLWANDLCATLETRRDESLAQNFRPTLRARRREL